MGNKKNFTKKRRALASIDTLVSSSMGHYDTWRQRQDDVTAEPGAPCSKLPS